jgi:hypothetical protein
MGEEARLRAETIAYYEGLLASERREDAAMAKAAARAARRLRLDES